MFASAPNATAAADSSVSFADATPVSLGGKPIAVTLVNNTAEAWTVSVSAHLNTGDDGTKTVSIPVTGAPKSIQPSGSSVFTIGPAPSNISSGSGFVVATAKKGSQTVVVRRAVKLATPTPAAKKWSGSSRRLLPGGDRALTAAPSLPLTGATFG